jgi:redox-sensitive bicupin YhaK (pirin superfamily)
LLDGQIEHKDSFGNRGLLEAGDVQWMTAGSGLVHSEMPGRDLVRTGGRPEGFQSWVNLPRRDKMTAPRYQELKAAAILRASNATGDVQVRVIAGESLGTRGAIESRTPIPYLHLTLLPGREPRPRRSAGQPDPQGEGRVVVFANDSDEISISNPSARADRAAPDCR